MASPALIREKHVEAIFAQTMEKIAVLPLENHADANMDIMSKMIQPGNQVGNLAEEVMVRVQSINAVPMKVMEVMVVHLLLCS